MTMLKKKLRGIRIDKKGERKGDRIDKGKGRKMMSEIVRRRCDVRKGRGRKGMVIRGEEKGRCQIEL